MSTTPEDDAEDYVEAATAAYRNRLEDLIEAYGTPVADPASLGLRSADVTAAGLAWAAEVGPFLDTDGVRNILGNPTRQAVGARVRNRRILALRTAEVGGGARLLYPLWQFDGDILEHLPGVLAAVGYDPDERTHGWWIASWLCAADPDLEDQRPRDLLAGGHVQPVLDLAAEVRIELGLNELPAMRSAGRVA